MIIDKTALTTAEQSRLKELSPQIKQALFEFSPTDTDGGEAFKENPQYKEYCAILAGAEDRYIDAIAPNYAEIIGNVKEIVSAYTAQDFLSHVEPVQDVIKKELTRRQAQLDSETDAERQRGIEALIADAQDRLFNYFSLTYIGILNTLRQLTGPEGRALERGGHTDKEYIDILEARATEIEAALPGGTEAKDQLSLFDDAPEGNDQPQEQGENVRAESMSIRRQAQLAGAIMGVGDRQLSITDKKYQYALTPKRNAAAFITMLDASFMEQLVFNDGQLDLLRSGMMQATIKKKTRDGLKTIKDLDLPLLRQLCTAVYNTAKTADINTVTVYLPPFCREMGVDIQGGKPADLFAKLDAFKNCIGVLENGSYWKLFEFLGFDKENNTLTFAMPYINRLLLSIADRNTIVLKSGRSYETPAYCWLMHSSVVSVRNKPAVEIANFIITGLQQRGHIPDAELKQNKGIKGLSPDLVTYSVSFRAIINDIPLLRDRLEETKTTADKNKKISRAFTGAYKILKTKTDAYKYYIGLSIPAIIPTMTTLDNLLTITHTGKNGNYKLPKHGELS